MKFRCNVKEFNKVITKVRKSINDKNKNTDLTDIKLSLVDEVLTVTGVNEGIMLNSTMKVTEGENGMCFINAKAFGDTIKGIKSSEIELKVEKEKMNILFDKNSLILAINGQNDAKNDYFRAKNDEKVQLFSINSKVFYDMITKCLVSISADESNSMICSVHIKLNEKLECSTIDGYRLTRVDLNYTKIDDNVKDCLLFGDYVKVLNKAKFTGELLIESTKDKYIISNDQDELIFKRLDNENFLDIDKLLKGDSDVLIPINSKVMFNGLESIKNSYKLHKNNKVNLVLECGILNLIVVDDEGGVAQWQTEVGGTDSVNTFINGEFLREMFKSVKDENMIMKLRKSAHEPIKVEYEDYKHLVLPIRHSN